MHSSGTQAYCSYLQRKPTRTHNKGRHWVDRLTQTGFGDRMKGLTRAHRKLATHWKYCLTCAEYISLASRSLRSKSVSYFITSAGTPFSFLLMCCCSSLFRKYTCIRAMM